MNVEDTVVTDRLLNMFIVSRILEGIHAVGKDVGFVGTGVEKTQIDGQITRSPIRAIKSVHS